jgi:hypothetical protein
VLLAEDLIGNWQSPTVPQNSIAESNVLEDVLAAIDQGEGASENYRPGGGGGGGGGGAKKSSKKKIDNKKVVSKYSSPGRYALIKWKKKPVKKPSAVAT